MALFRSREEVTILATAREEKLVNWLITRPIILLDEMILFNFVMLIAGVGVSNSGIQSRLSSRLSDYRR